MLAATFIRTSNVINTGILCTGVVVGGWLVLRPDQLLFLLGLDREQTDWSRFLVQLIGQLMLGVVVIPVVVMLMQWWYAI